MSIGSVKPGARRSWEYEALLDRLKEMYAGIANSTQDSATAADAKNKFFLIDQLQTFYTQMIDKNGALDKEKPPGCVCDLLDKVKLKGKQEPYYEMLSTGEIVKASET